MARPCAERESFMGKARETAFAPALLQNVQQALVFPCSGELHPEDGTPPVLSADKTCSSRPPQNFLFQSIVGILRAEPTGGVRQRLTCVRVATHH